MKNYYYYTPWEPNPWQPIQPQDPLPPTEYGWRCPACGTVNAPWRPQCTCVPPTVTTTTYGTSSTNRDDRNDDNK